jgi:Mor family transcriptional regulator
MSAMSSRMPALNCAPAPDSDFDPWDDVERTSLYDQIAHSIGCDAADKLIADFGGRRLYIPVAPAPGDLLSRSIGLLPALALARTFGGDRLMIPVTSTHARRRARIVSMRANNVSIARIAHELRCTERYVYKVLSVKRVPAPPAAEMPPALSRECSPSFEARAPGLGYSALCNDSAVQPQHATSAPIAERLKRGPINHRT